MGVALTSAALRPLAPCIRLRVGVSGHRVAPKLPVAAIPSIRAGADRALLTMANAARKVAGRISDQPPEFSIVSALAEGSDRIIAEAGLAAGYVLEAVLPFRRTEYLRDFENSRESTEAFGALLGCAASVFEIDGDPVARPRAYETAGFVMLANIDVLIAIWDGKVADGIGGTYQIVGRAIAEGIPVIWIDPTSPTDLKLSWPKAGELAFGNALPNDTFRTATFDEIAEAIRNILLPPSQKEAVGSLTTFLAEKVKRWHFCPWYLILLFLFSDRPISRKDFQIATTVAAATAEWQSYFDALPADKTQRPVIQSVLLPAYYVADRLAVYYAHVYRGAYVFNFMFAAVAVTLALAGIFLHEPRVKSYVVAAELMVILAVLVTWLFGHRRQWHRRWLEYRRLAECIRQMRILAPIGLGGPAERPRPGIEAQDWGGWYAWSLRRVLPLPNRIVDVPYLEAVRNVTRSAEISGQVLYHSMNATQIHKIDKRMHRCGQYLFAITALICFVFLVSAWSYNFPNDESPHKDFILNLLTLFTALLPMLGAALGAISVQGEFKTVREQSERTARRLEKMDAVLAAEELTFSRLCDRLEKTSDIMMADVDEWQTVFRTRPLSLPV
jgi:hypothetical protein